MMSELKNLSKWSVRIIAVLALLAATAGPAQAQISGTVYENTLAAQNAVVGADTSDSTGSAHFTTSSINYSESGPPGTVAAFLNNPTFTGATGSFDPNAQVTGPVNGTGTYIVLTGTLHLNAGANNFSITHDDGVQFQINGTNVISSPGPTPSEVSNGSYTAASAGNYSFTLAYGEVNGLPAVLQTTLPLAAVPEPSTMAIAGLGAIGFIAYGLRRRKARTA
jgi:hypothetical protein